MTATLVGALAQIERRLTESGCDTPRIDAEIILAHVLGTSRAELYADSRRSLTGPEDEVLAQLVDRRAGREPLAYVIGEWGFRRLSLSVDRRVLVPRPETEVVVERGLALLEGVHDPRVLDVGTGSGAIALAIADEHPGARVTGIDSSSAALAVARENVEHTGLAVELQHRDLFDGLPKGPWDLVIANPPYVLQGDIDRLEPEVREWEPREALVGEGATQAIAESAFEVLRERGALVLETAEREAGQVGDLLRGLGYGDVLVTRDLGGRERVVEGRRS